jgi:transposase
MNSALPATSKPWGLPLSTKSHILCFLLLGWSPHDITVKCRIHLWTVYKLTTSLLLYSSLQRPKLYTLICPQKLTVADKEALLELLFTEGWRHQDEIVYWLWIERGVLVSQSTVSRLLKRRKWTRKELQCISLDHNKDLWARYQEDIHCFVTEDLVFLDESIFNEKTGWRYCAYGPIGYDIHYSTDVQHSQT